MNPTRSGKAGKVGKAGGAISYHRCRVGLNHLAFHAVSREQVDNLTMKLKEKGVKILYPERHPFAGGSGHYAVFFEDPDRMKVEIVAPEQ